MTFDSMSDSCLFQLREYFNSNPYREYSMARPYMPSSAQTQRVSKCSFEQLHDPSPILDRNSYKLRMKSDLNVENVNATCRHRQRTATTNHQQQQHRRSTNTIKTSTRQTISSGQLGGIEGNRVRVGTLKDLIQQYHQEEIRLIQQPKKDFENIFHLPNNTNLIFLKPPPFLSKQTIRQPQALTEYRFDTPKSLSRSSPSPIYHSSSSHTRSNHSTKRIQESREKILLHTEKQVCICNKLTIIDPYNAKQDHTNLPSNGYFFPPIRAFGYFRRKTTTTTTEQTPPLLIKKKTYKIKVPKTSPELVSSEHDDSSQLLTEVNKSSTTLTDLDDDDDVNNPPNTTINLVLK